MRNRAFVWLLCLGLLCSALSGCGKKTQKEAKETEKKEQTSEKDTEQEKKKIDPLPLPQAVVHYTFDEGAQEDYKVVVADPTKQENIACAPGELSESVARTIRYGEAELAYREGPVGSCLYMDGSYGLDLNFEALGADVYSVSFWVNGDTFTDYEPTLQMGYNVGKADDQGNNVTWLNITQGSSNFGLSPIFPLIWSRNEASDSANGKTDCWPFMYSPDKKSRGLKEWVMVTLTCTGEMQASPMGTKTVASQLYLDGELVYDSGTNFKYGNYFDYTWDATLAPNIMKPGKNKFESYFGINYWDNLFCGYVDDFYVFDTALSAGQVLTLYQMGDPTVNPNAQ